MKVREALDSIRRQDLVLPEFQREYVWTKDQAKQLMVSLRRGYPVGGLLVWKTDKPPELKNVRKLPEKLRSRPGPPGRTAETNHSSHADQVTFLLTTLKPRSRPIPENYTTSQVRCK